MGQLFSVMLSFSNYYLHFINSLPSFVYNPYYNKDSHIIFMKTSDKAHAPLIKCYDLKHLSHYFLRKYIHRHSAVELVFLSGYSIYLAF